MHIASDDVVSRQVIFGECIREDTDHNSTEDDGYCSGDEAENSDTFLIHLRKISVDPYSQY